MTMKSCTICFLAILTVFLLNGCAERQNPTSGNVISYISRIPVRGQAKGVAVVHDTAYVSDKDFGVSVYDLTDPANPRLVDSLDQYLDAASMDYIAVDSTGRLLIIEQAFTSNLMVFDLKIKGPPLMGFGTGFVTKVQIYYDQVTLKTYRTDSNSLDGFFAENYPNTGTPENPVFGGYSFFAEYPIGAWGFAYDPATNRAVSCMDLYGFAYLDLNTVVQQTPRVLCQMNTPGATRDAALSGNIICLASGYEGLLLVDVSNDTVPVLLASMPFNNSHNIERVIVSGSRAYLMDKYDAVYAVDISNPSAPQLIGSISVSTADDFAIDGNLVVIADEDEGLIIGQIMY
jgi:hypothetical protein